MGAYCSGLLGACAGYGGYIGLAVGYWVLVWAIGGYRGLLRLVRAIRGYTGLIGGYGAIRGYTGLIGGYKPIVACCGCLQGGVGLIWALQGV